MKKEKPIQWLKIKAEYLQGCKPAELAEKYGLKAKQISDKANEEKWVAEKAKISENVREVTEEKIQKLTGKALNALEQVINDPCAKNADIVAASKAILDISGLKKSKQEITGKDGEPIVQKVYATPEEYKEAIKHIQRSLSNG